MVAAGARGVPVFERRAVFRRAQFPFDPGLGARRAERCRGSGADHPRSDDRADGAAAPLRRRGHRHRRRRHADPRHAACRCGAAVRARDEGAALSGEDRRDRAGHPGRRCRRQTASRHRDDRAAYPPQRNSVLQASDFSQGSAKYVTQVIDETVEERQIASTEDVQHLHFDAPEAGVYIVELEAADRIGRRQTLRVDLFMAGDTPVTWSQPPSQTVAVSSDKDSYAPGETATLVIQSPFQTARALAVVEEPEGRFRYDWVDIANGFGRYAVLIRKEQMPR